MSARLFSFIGGDAGPWRIVSMETVAGEPLPAARRLDIVAGATMPSAITHAAWALQGITSNERYVVRSEKNQLVANQPGLGRPEATQAALIPIRKNAAWWALTQDERRHILEEQSKHIQVGLQYLPAVARRLHHCRDLSESEPFDFLTWFEFALEHEEAFNALVKTLRSSEEWKYVERESDIRLVLEKNRQ